MNFTSNRNCYTGVKAGEYNLTEVGEKFGPLTYPIDDHVIKTYAFTQDDYNPWYFTDNNPFGKRIIHSSLLGNDLLRLFLTAYDPTKIVGLHTQEELWFCNPLFAGEDVTLQGEYVEKYETRGKGYVVMEASAAGADGRLIMKHRGVEIMKILGSSITEKNTAKIEGEPVTGEYDHSMKPAQTATKDIAVGTPLASLVKATTPEQTQVFSGIGLYFENIHNNIQIARQAGYEGLVVQGMQEVGYITQMLTDFFGASWLTSGYEKIKMVRPVLAGETITFSGVVRSKSIEGEKMRLHLHVWGKNSNGEMTAVGWASAFV